MFRFRLPHQHTNDIIGQEPPLLLLFLLLLLLLSEMLD